jgi:uncharacterized membrane protein
LNFRLKSAFFLNALVSVFFIISGLRYLLSPQIMLYHLQVINRNWGDLDSRLQIMFLGFLKLGGAGMLTVGLAIALLLLIPFRRGYIWAYRAILVIGFVFIAPVLYIASSLHYSTGASTPWLVAAITLVVILVAYLLTLKAEGQAASSNNKKKAIA